MSSRVHVQYGSVEVVPLTVRVDGVKIGPEGVEVTTAPNEVDPTDWGAPTVLADGTWGILVNGLAKGTHTIYARVTAPPEIAIVDCGQIVIS